MGRRLKQHRHINTPGRFFRAPRGGGARLGSSFITHDSRSPFLSLPPQPDPTQDSSRQRSRSPMAFTHLDVVRFPARRSFIRVIRVPTVLFACADARPRRLLGVT